jgi:hypothetical protein
MYNGVKLLTQMKDRCLMSFKELATKEFVIVRASAKQRKEFAFERASAKHMIDIKPEDVPAADQPAAPAETASAPHAHRRG